MISRGSRHKWPGQQKKLLSASNVKSTMLEPNRTKNQITNTKKKSIPLTDLNKRTKDRFATKALTLLPSSFSFQARRPLHSLGRGIFVYLLSNPKPYSIVPNTGNRPDNFRVTIAPRQKWKTRLTANVNFLVLRSGPSTSL